MESNYLIAPGTPWYTRIKLHRTALGLTQQQVADQVGVQHRRYWGWEAGKNVPRPEHQQKLASVLGVDPDALFGGSVQDFTGLARK